MKNLNRLLLLSLLFASFFISGCFKTWDIKYERGLFSDTVKNLTAVNSSYDDFNSSGPPTISFTLPLVFSSNRYTLGKKYDLMNYELWAGFNQVDGTFVLNAYEGQSYPYYYLEELSNTEDNEFGPYTAQLGVQEYFFLFSSDRTGNMEIYTSYFNNFSFSGISPIDPEPFRIKGINSPQYDAYPALNANRREFLFSSNRDGDIDIYRVKIAENADFLEWAKADTTYPAEKVTILNSDSVDIFPYSNDELLVFSSKRAGGYGGYDLYYSRFDGTEWQQPVNFGPTINTAADECRPVVFLALYFTNDLMIFSSDREGGKGGFDLYYVGIPKMIE
ncbi:MAG: hypothetical protein A2X22_11320 [Bacteroidetes bacterium GWF2_49_14]|nr:MAG: hypothetical protein A2X22_11320 [Bacteroidetes bacterium GWF2_49_14]